MFGTLILFSKIRPVRQLSIHTEAEERKENHNHLQIRFYT